MGKDGIDFGSVGKAVGGGSGGSGGLGGFFRKWWNTDEDTIKDAIGSHPYHDQAMAPVPMIQGGIVPRQAPSMTATNPYYDPSRFFRMPGAQPFGGYFADGGKAPKNKRIVVGEEGPEQIVLPEGGTVIPASGTILNQQPQTLQQPPQDPTPVPAAAPPAPTDYSQPAPAGLAPVIDPSAVASASPVGDTAPPISPAAPVPPSPSPTQAVPLAVTPATNGVEAAGMSPAAAQQADSGPAAMDPNDPRSRLIRRPSENTWDKIEQTYQDGTTPATDTKHRLGSGLAKPATDTKHRLGSGLAKGFRTWEPGQGSGGIFGLLAHTLFGGIGSAVSQKQYDSLSRDDKRSKLIREQLEPELAYEKADTTLQNAQLQPYFKQQQVDLKREQFVNRIYRDREGFAAKLEQIRAKAEAEGGRWKPFVDAATGAVLKTFPNDPTRKSEPMLDENGQPIIDPLKKAYQWQDPYSGETFAVTGAQATQAGSTILTANQRAENSAGMQNTEQQNQYQRQVDLHTAKLGELGATATGAAQEADAADATIARLDAAVTQRGYAKNAEESQQYAEAEKTSRAKRAEATKASTDLEYLKAHPPTPPSTYTPKTIRAGSPQNATQAQRMYDELARQGPTLGLKASEIKAKQQTFLSGLPEAIRSQIKQ